MSLDNLCASRKVYDEFSMYLVYDTLKTPCIGAPIDEPNLLLQ